MTPTEAAKVIGCTPAQVRNLIRGGTLSAESFLMPGGFYYDVRRSDVQRYAREPQKQGFPRGEKRPKRKK